MRGRARCHAEKLLCAEGENRAYPLFQKDPPWPVRVVVVGEAPNFDDSFDRAKQRLTVEPDTDPSGAFMFDLLASVGLRPEEVLFTNSVLCLPARNGEGKHYVTARQQDLCAEWLGRLIDVANPVAVVTLGGVALQALDRLERHGLSLRENAGKLNPWRGRHLLPLYHPGRLGRIARPEAKQREDIAVLRNVLDEVPVLDAATANEVMQEHPGGARLVLRSGGGRSTATSPAPSGSSGPAPPSSPTWLLGRVRRSGPTPGSSSIASAGAAASGSSGAGMSAASARSRSTRSRLTRARRCRSGWGPFPPMLPMVWRPRCGTCWTRGRCSRAPHVGLRALGLQAAFGFRRGGWSVRGPARRTWFRCPSHNPAPWSGRSQAGNEHAPEGCPNTGADLTVSERTRRCP